MPTLYHFEGSPWCWKVRIALAEKRIAYKAIVPVNRDKDPQFQKLTPVGKVPVLVLDDGVSLIESTVINEYLEEKHPHPALLPREPEARARCRMIEEVADAYLAPALRLTFTARYRYDAGKIYQLKTVNRDQEAEGLRIAGGYLDYLNSQAVAREYLCGQFSLADIGLIPPITRSARLLDLPMLQRWPNLAGWAERALSRPSVKATAPPPYQILDEPV